MRLRIGDLQGRAKLLVWTSGIVTSGKDGVATWVLVFGGCGGARTTSMIIDALPGLGLAPMSFSFCNISEPRAESEGFDALPVLTGIDYDAF